MIILIIFLPLLVKYYLNNLIYNYCKICDDNKVSKTRFDGLLNNQLNVKKSGFKTSKSLIKY